MSPLNRGPLLGPRMPPGAMRPPLPRFGGRLPMPGLPPRMPPPMGPMFGPMRQRMMPPRAGGMMRSGGPPPPPPPPPPPLFGPRARGLPPLMPPMMNPRGMGPRGLPIRPGPRALLPPQGLAHIRPRFPMGNGNIKGKPIANPKKVNKLEELELKKPWMTDEIRSEIQKKNKLYAKAKKNKDAKEWDEFKDLRNKVTRMIRDAKNEYLAKHPEQAHIYQDDEEQPYDQRDENYVSSEDEMSHYCEVCDREFLTAELLERHEESHAICGIDGCIFSAHPKLVEKHITMQHSTGLYHRMKNLSTPEDIQKWIAERKKKYPTKFNIEQKKAEETEKIERGEIIEAKNSSTRRKLSDKPVREKKRKLRKRKTQDCKAKPEPVSEFYLGLRPFAGTANLHQETNKEEAELEPPMEESECITSLDVAASNISDEEDQTTLEYERLRAAPECSVAICNSNANQSSLVSLVANYGSDSTDDDDGPVEIPIKRVKSDLPVEETKTVQISISSAAAADTAESTDNLQRNNLKILNVKLNRRDSTVSKSARDKGSDLSKEYKLRRKKRDNITNVSNDRDRKRLMLLQRLLSRSMQHERNLICQCIKHIADNNFLQ